jgi:nucleoside-diphosphate-sugar epimerase
MQTVAIVGANGFVGRALCETLATLPQFKVEPITRASYAAFEGQEVDILINCSMPSARFRAKTDPQWDFRETVEKTAALLYRVKTRKFVQVSSISARSQLDTVYGRHKAAAEKLCGFGDNLIVRLGSLYGPGLVKGVLIDMAQRKKVFVDGRSRYCFAPLEFSARWIAENLHRSGTVEIGGKNAVSLESVSARMGLRIEFEGALDHQEIEGDEVGCPEASDVFSYVDVWKKQRPTE